MSDHLESMAITGFVRGQYDLKLLNDLDPAYFFVHRAVYESILNNVGRYGKPPTAVTLQSHHPSWKPTPAIDPFPEVLKGLALNWYRVQVSEDLGTAVDLLYDGPDGPTKAISHLQTKMLGYDTPGSHVTDLTSPKRLEYYQKRRDAFLSDAQIGIPTGFNTLDCWMHGGLQNSEYSILMGSTGVGKSWTAMAIATAGWRGGYSPLYVMLESDEEHAGYRFDALVSHVENSRLFTGTMDFDDYRGAMRSALDTVKKDQGNIPPFWLATVGNELEYTPGHIWQLAATKRPDFIIVDYLTLMTLPGEISDDWRVAGMVSKQLAMIAKVLKIPLMAIVQGRRSTVGATKLNLDDIGISYGILKPADVVVAVTKTDQELYRYEIIKARNLYIPTGTGNAGPAFFVKADWNKGLLAEDRTRVI